LLFLPLTNILLDVIVETTAAASYGIAIQVTAGLYSYGIAVQVTAGHRCFKV